MQIKRLHKNLYKLYRCARTQECLDFYPKIYGDGVGQWKKLKRENVSDKLCQEMAGMSRATYYTLRTLQRALILPLRSLRT